MTVGDRYPGQSEIVSAMADAWKTRNYHNAMRSGRLAYSRHDTLSLASQIALVYLRRVWHGLRGDA